MKIIVVRGRIIRYEEGKEAEIFTLVIKGTNIMLTNILEVVVQFEFFECFCTKGLINFS